MWSEPWPFDKDEDVCLLYSRCTLVEFCAFLISLHWPSKVSDLGLGGASYLEILILCETWAVERLVIEQAVPRPSRRVCALFLCRLFHLVQVQEYGAAAGFQVTCSGPSSIQPGGMAMVLLRDLLKSTLVVDADRQCTMYIRTQSLSVPQS